MLYVILLFKLANWFKIMGKSYNKQTGLLSQSDSHHSPHDRGWSRKLKNDSYKSIRKHNKSGIDETNY